MFDLLKQALGSMLAFFFDLLDGTMSDGLALGFSIILLTIAINLLVFPLTLKQTRATRAFTAIQPQIKRLQKEHKDDPQEMQKKLMELQRSTGATPGGCLLPLLVQMPIWFGLFWVLQDPLILDESGALVPGAAHPVDPASALGTTLLDGADKLFLGMNLQLSPAAALGLGLATAIPYLVIIILMVATQYVQQWHAMYGQERPTNQPGAGAQQAITKVMPLFIGFVSWNFPAGLVLYWATSNLFRLGQQALIFKIDGRPTMPPVDEEEEGKNDKDAAAGEEPRPKPQPGNRRRRRRRR